MKDIQEQLFYNNLTNKFKTNLKSLIDKINIIKFYEKIQLRGTLAIIIFPLIYHIKDILSHKYNFDNMEFYLCVLFAGAFFILIEKMMESHKNNLMKIKRSIKNGMIVKICTCSSYCNCKEDFNNYIEDILHIKILD